MSMTMRKGKTRLALLWLPWSLLLFFVIFFQTTLGRYGDKSDEAWSWFLPTLVPTLSLIVSAWVAEARENATGQLNVDRFTFGLALGLSAAYLLAVSLTIFLIPVIVAAPLEVLKKSNLWLGPFQGLVSAAMGVFFVKKEK